MLLLTAVALHEEHSSDCAHARGSLHCTVPLDYNDIYLCNIATGLL